MVLLCMKIMVSLVSKENEPADDPHDVKWIVSLMDICNNKSTFSMLRRYVVNFGKLSVILFVIFIPPPTLQHFIWPLNWCVLADICNHTWIPECGNDGDNRLFIDDCDMFEHNCDRNRNYQITNYSDCFQYATCPTFSSKKYYRMGNYMYMKEDRKVIYLPTMPKLPKYMLKGKRRYTPTPKINRKMLSTKSIPKTTTKRKLVVLKRMPVIKDGKVLVKVVQGYTKKQRRTTRMLDSSDYLQR